MTTRQLMILVALLAAWLGFVARAQRLRGVGGYHMRQYAVHARAALDRSPARAEAAHAAKAQAARHLKTAEGYNIEADFVESFVLALTLTGVVFAIAWSLHKRRLQSPPHL
jgi:hypothetical protein